VYPGVTQISFICFAVRVTQVGPVDVTFGSSLIQEFSTNRNAAPIARSGNNLKKKGEKTFLFCIKLGLGG
jgi:hypothetical protein